jgi:hypothetical protein
MYKNTNKSPVFFQKHSIFGIVGIQEKKFLFVLGLGLLVKNLFIRQPNLSYKRAKYYFY